MGESPGPKVLKFSLYESSHPLSTFEQGISAGDNFFSLPAIIYIQLSIHTAGCGYLRGTSSLFRDQEGKGPGWMGHVTRVAIACGTLLLSDTQSVATARDLGRRALVT